MDLIIKPTEKCNFSCTFCSSPSLASTKNKTLDLELVYRFLDRFPNTKVIIVNGGDPLMMPPDYYWSILNYIEKKGLGTYLSLTTNLWGFYKNPILWRDLFRHPKVVVATSFNYGESRRITQDRVFSEDIFVEISDLFLQEVGYRPDFISVIAEDNEKFAIDNVLLAKRLNVVCKLNYAFASGRQSKPYLKSKIYRIYLEILDRGLEPWEYNSQQILKKRNLEMTTCPVHRSCDEGIRCLQPDGDYYSCGAYGDDKLYPVPYESEMKGELHDRVLRDRLELFSLKEDCAVCPLFEICNGCRKTITDLKSHNLVEEHCRGMQEILPQLVGYMSEPAGDICQP